MNISCAIIARCLIIVILCWKIQNKSNNNNWSNDESSHLLIARNVNRIYLTNEKKPSVYKLGILQISEWMNERMESQ